MRELNKPLPQRWNLEKIFPGGSRSEALKRHLDELAADIERFAAELPSTPVPASVEQLEPMAQVIRRMQDISQRLQEANAFCSCLVAQDVSDGQARIVAAQVRRLGAQLEAALTVLNEKLLAMSDEIWPAFLAHEAVAPVAFAMNERRRRAKERMAPDKEALVAELSVEGYHAWNQLYNLISGKIRVPVEENGKTVQLSVGQAANRLSDPDRETRRKVFDAYEQAWAEQADVISSTLNNLAGYRLTLYRYRGWDSFLKEPLDDNRMTEATLRAMWAAVEQGKGKLLDYFAKKAALLGIEKLSWYDLTAPVGEESSEKIPYDEAAQFIIDNFGRFSPRLQALAVTAFNEGWIEAEDRPGKGAGGFCTTFPLTKESRIFLTYGGRRTSVDTLAHELGHAYHSFVLKDLPPLARRYPMALAETASTLAEMIVSDAALSAVGDERQRLALLDNRLSRATAFLMDIHARFLFETSFYEARRKGALSVDELNARMETAQKQAFLNALERYHPLFWASKLHFHITYAPFYNFPYTFGYLFSAGIYARKQELGGKLADVVDGLLLDTGRMTVEDLAKKHLGADLQRETFWLQAVEHVLADVDEFVRLADKVLARRG